ncbi:hypothetical protein SAY86_022221 [Trapa natans]|uniref:Uncharacterized protein n=1 Tax=Trapa natans TaxID=22666 RepID=A0AAN7MB16_TRANT|nr:hypothetical protein SAY86_022221 [Trapa natans]
MHLVSFPVLVSYAETIYVSPRKPCRLCINNIKATSISSFSSDHDSRSSSEAQHISVITHAGRRGTRSQRRQHEDDDGDDDEDKLLLGRRRGGFLLRLVRPQPPLVPYGPTTRPLFWQRGQEPPVPRRMAAGRLRDTEGPHSPDRPGVSAHALGHVVQPRHLHHGGHEPVDTADSRTPSTAPTNIIWT